MAAVEYVLLVKTQQVCLFQVPTLTTSKGYYLDDWKTMFWEGGCKLTEKGGQLNLYFIDKNTQAVQAQVALPDNPYEAIQKTIDSSRGYAVRLVTPTGAYQWVGCVFRDRNDAFDFNAKIGDFLERREMERNPQKFKNEFAPTQDFSLKEGQKLQISLNDGQQQKNAGKKKQEYNLNDFKFAPPPDEAFGDFNSSFQPQIQKPQASQQQQPQATASVNWNDFNFDFSAGQQNNASKAPNTFTAAFPASNPPNQSNAFASFAFEPLQPGVQNQQQKSKPKNAEFNLLDL